MADKTKKIVYFGTDGSLGHYPKGVNCELSADEYDELKGIDLSATEDLLQRTGGWFRYLTKSGSYTCFGVPYSLDDRRPDSKSIVMVSDGSIFDVIRAVNGYAFLRDKFKELNERFELNIDFINQIGL